MTDVVVVTTAIDDEARAAALARELVEGRLAACVQVIGGVRSTYRWRGEVEQADELLVLVKTTAARSPAVQAAIAALHTYELPEITVAPLSDGSAGYLAWVRESVS